MKTAQAWFFGILAAWLFTLSIFFVVSIKNQRGIRTDAPITPELRIRVTDGVADTTYIYRNRETK